MKPVIIIAIAFVLLVVGVGYLFYSGTLVVTNPQDNVDKMSSMCVEAFDVHIIPILTGQKQPSAASLIAGQKFVAEKCATNHKHWEELSLNQAYIRQAGWASFIQSEQAVIALQEEEQKLEDIKSDIEKKDLFSEYSINTECELVLILLMDYEIAQFTFVEIQSEEFKAKYPSQIQTIAKYNDLYQLKVAENRDASDAYKAFPPEVLDATFEIMSKEKSVNPELKSFVNSLFLGELTDERANQIASEDKTQCGPALQKLL